ncbi:MAG: hypothetical protein FJZ01_20635 [Candidatus Sericytochromatia bacterium]|nr:hypothetical protein [Candidatus Tanganyikabacteria bacterium]
MQAIRKLALGLLAAAVCGCQWGMTPAVVAGLASASAEKGAAASAVDTRPRGFLKLAIRWPTLEEQRNLGHYRAQLVPDSAAKMDIRVYDGSTEVGNALNVTRTGSLTNVTIELRAKNNLSVDVKVYPASPNQATQIAAGSASGVNIYSSAATNVTVTLVADYVPSISNLSASAGSVGQTVTLTGTNFRKAWAAAPKVWFNATVTNGVPSGVEATPTTSSDTSIAVVVPTGATTGNIVVEADNVPSASTANYYVLSSLAITAASVTINGHTTGSDGLVAGMVYYGDTLDFTAVGTFAMKSGEDLTTTWINPPAPTWASANANNTISTNSGPTIGSATTTTVGRMQAAGTNQTGNITATIGSVTSNAILAQPVGVDSVTVSPTSATINARPPTGTALDGNNGAISQAVTATVNSTLPFNDGVTWSTVGNSDLTITSADIGTDPAIPASTTTSATVTTKRTASGAAADSSGNAKLRATSITATAKSVSKTADTTLTITDYGNLVLGIQ